MKIISQGRVIAETDRERIAVGIRKFEDTVGPPMLDLLSWMVTHCRTGILWTHLQVANGELLRYSLEIKFTEEFQPGKKNQPEDVELELKRFTRLAAGEILRMLSDAIVRRESGWIHPHLKLHEGKLTRLQYSTDFGKALDEQD